MGPHTLTQQEGITKIKMQAVFGVFFCFFFGQRSVAVAWATPSPYGVLNIATTIRISPI